MENKLFELAAKRRSVRRYTDEHIDDAVISELLGVPEGYAVLNLIARAGRPASCA